MRVASVPHDHPYVRRVTTSSGVEVVGDPSGRGDGPHMLDPTWFAHHAATFDVAHVHFGFERLAPHELQAWLDCARDHNVPVVLTVHDLRNPHLHDNTRQEQLLDVFVPAAARVVTLTNAAADEVRARWGRNAVVLPHPHVASIPWLQRAAERPSNRGRRRVGLHLKSLRANFAPVEALDALRGVLALAPDAHVEVRLHNDVDGPPLRPVVDALVRAHPDRCTVLVSDYLPDDDLYQWIESLDVVLLPYRFGTHSGWIELGRDLGTAMVTPDLPTYREQGAAATFTVIEERPTAEGMRDAVMAALLTDHRPLGADVRREQAARVATAHQRLYAEVARLDDTGAARLAS